MNNRSELRRYGYPYLVIGKTHLKALPDFPLDVKHYITVRPDMPVSKDAVPYNRKSSLCSPDLSLWVHREFQLTSPV